MDIIISMDVNATAPAPSADSEAAEPQVAILFIGVSLFLGMASRHLLAGFLIPYTVALLLLGIALGGLGGFLLSLLQICLNKVSGSHVCSSIFSSGDRDL